MKRMVRPITTIAMVLTFMLVLTISVGGTNNLYAAKKLFDDTATNINLKSKVEDQTVCGVSGDFNVKTHVSKVRLVSWDNGHSTFQITFGSQTYDSDGKLIANVPVISLNQDFLTPSDFRFHVTFQVNAVCTGNSETPGKSESWSVIFFVVFNNGEVEDITAIARPL